MNKNKVWSSKWQFDRFFMSTFNPFLLAYLNYRNWSTNCEASFHYGECDIPEFLLTFSLGTLLLFPFYYIIFDILRKQHSMKGGMTNQMLCYCFIFAILNIFRLYANFMGANNFHEDFMTNLRKIYSLTQFLKNYAVFCFFLCIARFLSLFEASSFRFYYSILNWIQYIYLIFFVILFINAYYEFPQRFESILMIIISYQFDSIYSSVIVGLSVIVMFQCFIVSNIQHFFHPKLRFRLKILIFMLCLCQILSLIIGILSFSRTFSTEKIVKNKFLRKIFPVIYIFSSYSVGYSFLGIVIILSSPAHDAEIQSEIDLSIIS